MIIKKLVYSGIAAAQLVRLFNEAYGTNIAISSEILDGSSFVLIDFGETPIDLIFLVSYELGISQKTLMKARELFLLPELYRLPAPDSGSGPGRI